MEFTTVLTTTLKKSATFNAVGEYIGDNEISKMVIDILEVIKSSKSEDHEEDIAVYIIETFEFFDIEIDFKEAEDLARIIKWEYDEFRVGKFDTYKSIVGTKQPEHKIIGESSSEEN
ncbi:hypothetical protein NBO_10g0041 [Nosema bombycis CQ1]|uniref:Uncharacterized protein n=1 Tax=Nosema bombycis (strain CQ1 / CVCC 102059) TaxID=578461 RepID=R0KVW4_NOSB1|nr:hypothetical protein NBO_10g0041 [Nosema bombycis CQ1]|eukprot:EOB15051.1 hypothetical protein NBO_10g0041 [Nosema bombycis CQ1]